MLPWKPEAAQHFSHSNDITGLPLADQKLKVRFGARHHPFSQALWPSLPCPRCSIFISVTLWCADLLERVSCLLGCQRPGFPARRAEKPHLLRLLLWVAGKEVRKGLLCAFQFTPAVSHSGVEVKVYTQMCLLLHLKDL